MRCADSVHLGIACFPIGRSFAIPTIPTNPTPYLFLLTLPDTFPNLTASGAVPKWFKGADCKSVIHRFESDRRLFTSMHLAGHYETLGIPRVLTFTAAGLDPAVVC